MFSNGIFKTSFLISILAHLLVFILISPQINSGGFSFYALPKVNFVSVPLGELFLKNNLPDLNKMLDPSYDFFREKMGTLDILPEAVGIRQVKPTQRQDYIKVNPIFSKVDFWLTEYENKEISGPLKNRVLVSKPASPEIPVWFVERLTAPLEIKIWVDAKGDVVFCERLTSSGLYALDIIGIDYVRNFKFAPHTEPFQWGIVKISFNQPEEALKD
jgi:hypothetical protein